MKQIFLILFICCSSFGFCQTTNEVRSVEFELSIGPIFASNHNQSKQTNVGAAAGLEGRYNFSQIPFSIGIKSQIAEFNRRYDNNILIKNWAINTGFTFDYHIRKWKHISLITGAGLGVSFLDDNGYSNNLYSRALSKEKTVFYFNPHFGIEFSQRIRLSAGINLADKEHSFIGINFGFIIGANEVPSILERRVRRSLNLN